MKTILLIRHGLPQFPDGEPMCMGSCLDLPLSARGRLQAEEVARGLAYLPVEAVYTSPTLRCVETALPMARQWGKEPVRMEALRELCGGLWDGMTRRQIHENYPEYFRPGSELTPPGGESDQQALERSWAAMEEMFQNTRQLCVCVTHSSLIRVLACYVNGWPFGRKRSILADHAGILPLEWDGRRMTCPQRSVDVRTLIEGGCL